MNSRLVGFGGANEQGGGLGLKILFISLSALRDIETQGIYNDLLLECAAAGHRVCAMAPIEKREGGTSGLESVGGIEIIHVAVGNLTKTNLIEKGISTLTICGKYQAAYERFLPEFDPDLILFATPPTTLAPFVAKVKKATGAKAYLLLKDIFPQNSLDLGILTQSGWKGLIYKWFKRSERKTYEVCDFIGCMSPANIEFLLSNEPWLKAIPVELAPNSFRPKGRQRLSVGEKKLALEKVGVKGPSRVFTYGGNLGKPQAIPYLVEVLKLNELNPAGTFVIAGSGTERHLLEAYFEEARPKQAVLLPNLTPEEFDELLLASDAGLILLDRRFTIPNFPSRLLSYLQAGLPVVCATDKNTDIGKIAEENGFGLSCESANPEDLLKLCHQISDMSNEEIALMGNRARDYLEKNYTVEVTYKAIMRHFDNE